MHHYGSIRRILAVRGLKLAALLIFLALLAGCFQWTEDQQGNLQSVGVPGLSLWQSSKPPAPVTPEAMGFTPEQAAKFGGPVLVFPLTPPSNTYRYQYYETGQNHCEEDLEKLLKARADEGSVGEAPYCTEKPVAPASHGSAMIF